MASSFVLCSLIVALLCQYVLEVDAGGNLKGCFTGTYDANTDYFPDKSVVTAAESFNISYHNNYKVVSRIDLIEVSTETYVLFQCGTPAPSETNFPNGTKFFSIPVKTVTADDPATSFLNALGPDVLDTIRSVTDFTSTVPCIQKGIADGRISTNTVKTDIVFGTWTQVEVKYTSYAENTVLKRAEWLKFFGAFFNKESEANSKFKRTTKRYKKNKSMVTSSTGKPVVAILSDFGGKIHSAQRGYKPSLIADAGGVLANVSNDYDSTDKLVADLQRLNVSVLIDETYFFNLAPSLDKILAVYGLNQTSAQKYAWAKNIYREDKLISASFNTDWYSGGEVAADVVLNDFINVFNPRVPSASYDRTWLRNVNTQVPRVVTAADCADNRYNGSK